MKRAVLLYSLLFVLLPLSSAAAADNIPVTTSSAEARKLFIEGRTLVDNLRLTDAIGRFTKAVGKDPNFALAYLYLAQTAPTAKEFFAYVDKASGTASHASKGEQLWIAGFRAGSLGDPETQRKKLAELVSMFPDDERAQMLSGIFHFGQQEYETAAKEFERSIQLAPRFAPAYNQLGYVYRFLERYDDAGKTFRKYIALIPDDPNPYDSYAELLLKRGKFDEAIAQYRKALEINDHFANSFAGIAGALMYQGKYDEARAELRKAYTIARNDGEQRAALFNMAMTYLDEGNPEMGIKEFEKQYAIAGKAHDASAMSGDLTAIGNIQLDMGRVDAAASSFDKALSLINGSNLAREVKDNAVLVNHYNLGRIALARKDLATAKEESDRFTQGARASKNIFQIRLAHELAGMLALAEDRYVDAIDELTHGNQQNPYTLFRLALACQETGRKAEARKFATDAAHFNSLPFTNYALVRQKAEKLLSAI